MGALPQLWCSLLLLGTIAHVNSYTKYGRGCEDIGCLPNEECYIAHDSCNYGQRDGKECGSYPTCKRKSISSQQASGASLNPAPQNTRIQPSNPSQMSNNVNPSYNANPTLVNPNYVFGSPQNQPIYPNVPIFPHYQPTSPPPFQQFPQASHPQFPQYAQYPQNIPPQNPYNPPFVFGHQPTYFHPQATTKGPSLLHQFLYNKQDRGRNSSGIAHLNFMIPVACILGLIFRNSLFLISYNTASH